MTSARADRGDGMWLAPSPVGRRSGKVVTVLGIVFLLSIWLDAAGSTLPSFFLPAPFRFFTQVAELFPKAAVDVIEWRARGWRCDTGQFDELDVRPLFPIRRDDKENQFSRAMHFYHSDPSVLEALDQYVTDAHNRLNPDERVGGVMLLSLRIPIPPMGEPGPRERWQPLSDYPSTVTRRHWWMPPEDLRKQRCRDVR